MLYTVTHGDENEPDPAGNGTRTAAPGSKQDSTDHDTAKDAKTIGRVKLF